MCLGEVALSVDNYSPSRGKAYFSSRVTTIGAVASLLSKAWKKGCVSGYKNK